MNKLDYYRRIEEKEKEKERQKSAMDVRNLERKESIYHQAVAASQDRDYMADALAQVRQKSHITHSEDVLRKQGTWFYNKALK